MIDLHSHILPGIDDGSSSVADSMVLLRELAASGVTDVFATPHYVDETIYTSPVAVNNGHMSNLQSMAAAEGLPIRIHLGNEIYIFPKIQEFLASGEITGLGGSSYLLIELPMSGDYPGYYDIFLSLIRAGYKVVLAHPERYSSFSRDFSLITELYDMGVLLQCNLGSFAGQYGKTVRKLAERLAKEKMIWAVGSDIHHPHGSDFLPGAVKKLSKFYDARELEEILETNAGEILGA